jgi:hypothetical protein
VHELILATSPSGDWTLAASIMTFAIPVGLFIVVATTLYFLYTRPHEVPGHRDLVLAGAGAGTSASAAPAAPAASAAPAAPAAEAASEAPAADKATEDTE